MNANANIRITATTQGVKTAFKEAVAAVNTFTSDFKAKATEINSIGGRIGAVQDKIGRFSNQKAFQTGIISEFNKLNDQLLIAEGRQVLFGDSMATNRAKSAAYTSALNNLLAKGLQPNSEEAQNLAGKIKSLDNQFANNQNSSRFMSSLRGAAINGAMVLGTALLFVAGASLKAYAEFDGLSRGLETVEGSAVSAQRRIDGILSSLAKMPGLGLKEVIKGDVALRSQGFSAGGSERIQAAFGNAIASGGGGKDNFNQIITQLGQMAAKGKVLSEDLKPIITQAPTVAKALRTLFGTVSSEDISKALQAKGLDSRQFIAMLVTELEKAKKVTGGFKNELENADDALFQLTAEMGKSIDKNAKLTDSLRKTNDLMVFLKKPAAEWTGELVNGITSVALLAANTLVPVLALLAATPSQAKNPKVGFSKLGEGQRNKMMFDQIAIVDRLQKKYDGLEATYKKTGAGEKEFFVTKGQLEKATGFLNKLTAIDTQMVKAAKKPFDWGDFGKGGDKPDIGKEVDKWIKESNDRIEDGLRQIKMNGLDRRMAELAKEMGPFRLPIIQIDPTSDIEILKDSKLKDKFQEMLSKQMANVKIALPAPSFVETPEQAMLGKLESSREAIDKYFADMKGVWSANATTFGGIIAESLGGAFSNAFTSLGQAIATGENPFKAFGQSILSSFGDILIQIGSIMLKQAGILLAGSLFGGPAGAALGAEFYKYLAIGGALSVAGGAMKSVKLAKGGLATGPTMALVGEGRGTNSFRPEVIAPLPSLLGIISKAFSPMLKNFDGGNRQYAPQPIMIHTYNYTDGRETSRSAQRYNYKSSRINP